jgi:uncharacterized membrane protein YdbT with pleckstrin-like domain
MLREGEVSIISVTPVPWGVVRPLLMSMAGLVLIVLGAEHIRFVHRVAGWLVVIIIGPFLLVTLTRVWRWRSHKVHVTNQRVLLEGGVLSHQRTMIELRDVVATRVDQRLVERLSRRGVVTLETSGGSIPLGKVRHPGALCRLIDAERLDRQHHPLPFDTVFTFDEPSDDDFEIRPERRPLRDEWE